MASSHVKHKKAEAELARLAGAYLGRASHGPAMVSVSRVHLNTSRRGATIFLSVFPENHETEVLAFAKRHIRDVRAYLKEHIRIRAMPMLSFAIDEGAKYERHIDELLKRV